MKVAFHSLLIVLEARHRTFAVDSLVSFLHSCEGLRTYFFSCDILSVQPLGQEILRNAFSPGIVCLFKFVMLGASQVLIALEHKITHFNSVFYRL